ncbi:hypothetical protein Y032_0396g664 [Ancylostoma ceylanicum]|uniref:Uncharacterized protein n=1 Tax=Ancylostoma ceylanicum TaxID=53326 RepID=A0A016RRG2_9BILA|nr:hypothetical protein Y032_0396g664 [Ancylostoma ceylanicum]
MFRLSYSDDLNKNVNLSWCALVALCGYCSEVLTDCVANIRSQAEHSAICLTGTRLVTYTHGTFLFFSETGSQEFVVISSTLK